MTRVEKGQEFLAGISVAEIQDMNKRERNVKAKLRLQACLMRKKGKTLSDISASLNYPLTTVGDWLRRIHDSGLIRRFDIKQPGKPSYLSESQKDELRLILDESPEKQGLPYKVWTTKILGYFLQQKYNVVYKIRKLEQLVHQLGFNYKKARPVHRKANKKLQEDFKKTSTKELSPMLKMDGRSYFLMKASFK